MPVYNKCKQRGAELSTVGVCCMTHLLLFLGVRCSRNKYVFGLPNNKTISTMSKDDERYHANLAAEVDDEDSPSSTDHVDDNASDAKNNEVTSTENRPSEEEDTGHHDHDLKVSAATTLLGTAAQQQAEDYSPQSYRRSSLLSQTWQQDRHAQQTDAPLPPYQQHHTNGTAQLSTVSDIRQLELNEPSFLNQSLIGHSQHLAMNDRPVLPLGSDQLSGQVSMPMPQSLLEQIQQALTTQNLSVNQFAPQVPMMAGESATQAMARALLFQQQLSVLQNPSYFLMASHDHQYQAQVNQIQDHIRVIEQITALLLMQQQQQGTTNAATSSITHPDFNSYNNSMMQGHPAMSMTNQEHPAMAMMNLRNHMQQGCPQPLAKASAAAAAPAFNPAQDTRSLVASNMFDAPSLAVAQSSTVASQQRHPANTPSHDAKEKRWLIRYEELQQFHAVSLNRNTCAELQV